MKILLQNIQSGVNNSKGYWQLPFVFWKYFLPHSNKPILELGKYVKNNNVDVVVLTEIDSGSFRTFWQNQLEILSNNCSIKNFYFFKTFSFLNINNQGNAILSKKSIIKTKNIKLKEGYEPRFLSIAVINKYTNKKENITFLITHLSINKKARYEQLQEIKKIYNNIKGDKILLGDFNISSEKELDVLIDKNCRRVSFYNTFPSWNPKKPLDNVFLSKKIKIKNITTTKVLISDHLGIEFEIF